MTIIVPHSFVDMTLDPKAVRGWRLANAGAVPFTRRRSNGNYFRYPRGSKRAKQADARSVPPDAWDDIPIAALSSRTWKRHRRTQWHEAT